MTMPPDQPRAKRPGLPEESAGLLNRTTLTFIAFIACPVLGLVSAVLGLVMIFSGDVIMGVIFLVLVTQVFIIGGLWATKRRASLTRGSTGP